MAEESRAGSSEQFRALVTQNEERMRAIQEQIANQWAAQGKPIADQVEQQWNAQRKPITDLVEWQWNAQKKAI